MQLKEIDQFALFLAQRLEMIERQQVRRGSIARFEVHFVMSIEIDRCTHVFVGFEQLLFDVPRDFHQFGVIVDQLIDLFVAQTSLLTRRGKRALIRIDRQIFQETGNCQLFVILAVGIVFDLVGKKRRSRRDGHFTLADHSGCGQLSKNFVVHLFQDE